MFSNNFFTSRILSTSSFFTLSISLTTTMLCKLSIFSTLISYLSTPISFWVLHPYIRVGSSTPFCKFLVQSMLKFFLFIRADSSSSTLLPYNIYDQHKPKSRLIQIIKSDFGEGNINLHWFQSKLRTSIVLATGSGWWTHKLATSNQLSLQGLLPEWRLVTRSMWRRPNLGSNLPLMDICMIQYLLWQYDSLEVEWYLNMGQVGRMGTISLLPKPTNLYESFIFYLNFQWCQRCLPFGWATFFILFLSLLLT